MRFAPIPQASRVTKMYPMNGSATFKDGALVVLNASEEVVECGADPTAVLGIAAGPAENREINADKMLVHLATPESTFLMDGSSAFDANDVGVSYGVAKDGDGVWYVDKTDVTNLVVEIIAVDLVRDLAEVKVLTSDRQLYS